MHLLASPCLVVCSRVTTREPMNEFLGALATLQKETVRFVMRVRLRGTTRLPLDDLHEI